MGFWVMCLSALIGVICLYFGNQQHHRALKWELVGLGILFILFAVILALPH